MALAGACAASLGPLRALALSDVDQEPARDGLFDVRAAKRPGAAPRIRVRGRGLHRQTGDAEENHAAIVLDQAEHGAIQNARATSGCRRLIHVQGDSTREITVSGSRVPAGALPVTFETDAARRAVRVRDTEE